jgi:hypothetical protein
MSDKSKRDLIDSILQDSMIATGATGSDVYTITLDNNFPSNVGYSADTITITSTGAQPVYSMRSSLSSYTIGPSDTGYSNFNWGPPQEWVDSFPEWQRIQDMCSKYPGLEIALRNFRTIYTLVKDDYDNPKDKK